MDFISMSHLIAVNDYDTTKLKSMGISMKKKEPETFIGFVEFLINNKVFDYENLHLCSDHFFVDFTIPQISKEFDLLRLGVNYNINIELKSSASEEQQKDQLQKNFYYLNFLPSPTIYISFSHQEKRLIIGKTCEGKLKFIDDKVINIVDIFKIQNYHVYTQEEMENSFDIKNYLVSPFNNTQRFINKEYFLTDGQNIIKKEIIESDSNIFSIQGGPGTGKSLLIYDIAHSLTKKLSKQEVAVIHSGNLNHGHTLLKQAGINVLSAYDYKLAIQNKDLKYVLIDEAQRFYPDQLENVLLTQGEHNYKVVFSLDQEQAFDRAEVIWNNKEMISRYIDDNGGKNYKLKSKFRNNKELASFIASMSNFDKNIDPSEKIPNRKRNINLKYFRDYQTAEPFINNIKSDYELISFSPSKFKQSDPFYKTSKYGSISHDIIGQEFDNVAIIIDYNFFYKENAKGTRYMLQGTDKSHYLADRMFYQNITRAKEKLLLIVISNLDFFGKATSLLSNV